MGLIRCMSWVPDVLIKSFTRTALCFWWFSRWFSLFSSSTCHAMIFGSLSKICFNMKKSASKSSKFKANICKVKSWHRRMSYSLIQEAMEVKSAPRTKLVTKIQDQKWFPRRISLGHSHFYLTKIRIKKKAIIQFPIKSFFKLYKLHRKSWRTQKTAII